MSTLPVMTIHKRFQVSVIAGKPLIRILQCFYAWCMKLGLHGKWSPSVCSSTHKNFQARASLVPRPIPSFSMSHAEKRFSACNIEKLGMGLGTRLARATEDICPLEIHIVIVIMPSIPSPHACTPRTHTPTVVTTKIHDSEMSVREDDGYGQVCMNRAGGSTKIKVRP